MRRGIDGLEEAILRQAPGDIVPWLESYADPQDAGTLFDRWCDMQNGDDRLKALAIASRRSRVMMSIGAQMLGADGHTRIDRYLGCCGIKKLVRDGHIRIDPYCDANVHVDSVDLRLGHTRWVRRRDGRVIRPASAKREMNDLFVPVPITTATPLFLSPRATAQAETLETIELPRHTGLRIDNVSTQARFQLKVVQADHIHAGSTGTIMLEFVNEGDDDIVLYPEDVVVQAFLYLVTDNHDGYGENGMPLPNGGSKTSVTRCRS